MEQPFAEFLEESAPLLGGRYRLISLLGRGAAGSVFLAEDNLAPNQHLALKLLYRHLTLGEQSYARFRAESRITMRLSHPHILASYGMGQHEADVLFLKMEYSNGCSLADIIAGAGSVSLEERLRMLRDIACALEYAHQSGIIHRDLKPANVLVDQSGTVRVADFGIAQMLRQEVRMTGRGDVLGTPYYMPPEQLRSELLDGRADMYSFGILAFELLTGRVPFDADSFWSLAELHINEPLPLEPLQTLHAPEAVSGLIQGCTNKDRRKRFAAMADVVRLLEECCSSPQLESGVSGMTAAASPDPEPVSAWRYIVQKNSERWVHGLFFAGLLGCLLLPPHLNESARWRYAGVTLRIEQSLGSRLSWLRSIFNVPQDLAYPSGMFVHLKFKLYAWPLLMAGYNPNYYNEELGVYPLHFAVDPINTNRHIVKLAQHGADLNVRDARGNTALHLAVAQGKAVIARELLRFGANPSLPDAEGATPLQVACSSSRLEFARMLLAASGGADVNQTDGQGETPLHAAVRRGDDRLAALLIEYGASPLQTNSDGETPLSLAERIQIEELREAITALLDRPVQ